jgi:membrane-associated protease RseP (regulator of RpoE activity)
VASEAVTAPARENARRIEAGSPVPEPAPEPPTSQEELLSSVGFNAGAALGLRQRSDRFVQARDYLSKEAVREESAASLELARSQKKEIGEEAYSYMLWSAGIPNRVAVNEVLPDSSASRLGLQRGDIVLRYDGERVFEMDELAFLVREPSQSSSAEVEILRNGELMRLSAPRGVLGISIAPRFDPPREDLTRRRRARASEPSGASEK